MIRRSTWILLAIMALLIGAALLLQNNPSWRLSTGTATPTMLSKPLSGWNQATLVEISFKSAAGSTLTLKRNSDNTWSMVDQAKLIDQGKAQELLSTLISISPLSQVGVTASLEPFGISANSNVITLKDEKNKQTTIKIGNQAPTGSGYYLQVGNDPVIIASTFTAERLIELLSPQALFLVTPTPEPTTMSPAGPEAPQVTP